MNQSYTAMMADIRFVSPLYFFLMGSSTSQKIIQICSPCETRNFDIFTWSTDGLWLRQSKFIVKVIDLSGSVLTFLGSVHWHRLGLKGNNLCCYRSAIRSWYFESVSLKLKWLNQSKGKQNMAVFSLHTFLLQSHTKVNTSRRFLVGCSDRRFLI